MHTTLQQLATWALNPHTEQAQHHTRQWLKNMGLESTPHAAQEQKTDKRTNVAQRRQSTTSQAAAATPEPVKTEKVLTETWSYQLPADE